MRGWMSLPGSWTLVGQHAGIAWFTTGVLSPRHLIALDLARGRILYGAARPTTDIQFVQVQQGASGVAGPYVLDVQGQEGEGEPTMTAAYTLAGPHWTHPGLPLASAHGWCLLRHEEGYAAVHCRSGQLHALPEFMLDDDDPALTPYAISETELCVVDAGRIRRFSLDSSGVTELSDSASMLGDQATVVHTPHGFVFASHDQVAGRSELRITGWNRAIVRRGRLTCLAGSTDALLVGWDAGSGGLHLQVFERLGRQHTLAPDSAPRFAVADSVTVAVRWGSGAAWFAAGALTAISLPPSARESNDGYRYLPAMMIWDGFPILCTGPELIPLAIGAIPHAPFEALSPQSLEAPATISHAGPSRAFASHPELGHFLVVGHHLEGPLHIDAASEDHGLWHILGWHTDDGERGPDTSPKQIERWRDRGITVFQTSVLSSVGTLQGINALEQVARTWDGGLQEREDLRAGGFAMCMDGWGPRFSRDPHLLTLADDGEGGLWCAYVFPYTNGWPVVRYVRETGELEWIAPDFFTFWWSRMEQPNAPENVVRFPSISQVNKHAPWWFEMAYGDPETPPHPAFAHVARERALLRAYREGHEVQAELQQFYRSVGWDYALANLARNTAHGSG